MENIQLTLEALIFASEQSVTAAELSACVSAFFGAEITTATVEAALQTIRIKYAGPDFFMELAPVNKGFVFLTKKEYGPAVATLMQQKSKKKLSTAAMETLAIIAYKQPVTKPEVEQIRGVNCDYSIQRLLEKDLIQINGKSDAAGRPLLYATSRNFMDYFKLDSIDQLPQLKDLPREDLSETV